MTPLEAKILEIIREWHKNYTDGNRYLFGTDGDSCMQKIKEALNDALGG